MSTKDKIDFEIDHNEETFDFFTKHAKFHKRIWQAIKHVLGHKNAIEWDTTLIEDKKDVERLYLLVKEFHDKVNTTP